MNLTVQDFITIKEKVEKEKFPPEIADYALAFYELGFLRGQARAEEDHRQRSSGENKKDGQHGQQRRMKQSPAAARREELEPLEEIKTGNTVNRQ